MMLEWKGDTGTERGAYADWEAAQWNQTDEPFWPVFLEGPRVETTAHVDEVLRAEKLLLPQAEADWLATVRGLVHDGSWTGPLRTVVAVAERNYADLPTGNWKIRHVGPPLSLGPHAFARPTPRPIVAPAGEMVLPPIVAVIDDSIGYLNRRFREASNCTRIELLWQQNAKLADNASGSVSFGRVLTKADINRLIAEDRDEAEVYAKDADDLFDVVHPKIMRRRTSHGTAVLDLAAGGAPEDEDWKHVRDMPILAVQLPTFAVTDTSGRRLEPYVAQGLSWVVTEAMRLMGGGPRRPLIVNLSLGSLAGPGDDTAFLAALIDYEVKRFWQFTGAPMRLTAAYGNSRRGRLVGRAKVSASEPLEVEWRVQPDDRTSSFLELRAPAAAASHLSLALTEPGEGTASLHLPCWPEPGERHRAFSSGQETPCALVMGGDEGDFRTVLIALAPTEPNEGGVSVRPGGWKLCVRWTKQEETKQEETLVTLRVQRDDTPLGHWTRGRQSWLDHARGRTWSDVSKDWLDPEEGNPVTYEGTAVGYAGATAKEALFVGSAFPKVGEYCKAFTVAGFSAEGSPSPLPGGDASLRRRSESTGRGESTGPDLLAQSEDGRFLRGRRVSGMTSGTVARFGGTSMAAPMVARRLAVAFARHKGKLSDDEQWAALCGEGGRGSRDPHAGQPVLSVDCPPDIS